MNIAWLVWCVLGIILLYFMFSILEKRNERRNSATKTVLSSPRAVAMEGFMGALFLLLFAFGPVSLIEFPRISATWSGNRLQMGVPVSFENGAVTPHPWGAWNPAWNPRVMDLPAPWLDMVSFAPGQKGATYQVKNKEVGWMTLSFNLSVYITDYKTFFSLPERQTVEWDDKALRARIISDFLDIVDGRKDEVVAWASGLSTEEVRTLEVRSEVPPISEELVRRLGPLADGLSIRTTSTVLGPFREF